MPNEPRPHEQLAAYGSWLEGHLGTTLRSEVSVVARQPTDLTDSPPPLRRWLVALTAAASAIAVLVLAVAVFSGGRERRSTSVVAATRFIPMAWRATTDPPLDPTGAMSLAGGRAGFLMIKGSGENAEVLYSAHGDSWKVVTPDEAVGGVVESVAATTDALWLLARPRLAAGPTNLARLYRTTDGEHWTALTPSLLVEGPLYGAGSVLAAQVRDDVMQPAQVAVSTNGQDWSFLDGFPSTGVGSAAWVDGVSYIAAPMMIGASSYDTIAPATRDALFASTDGAAWRTFPAPASGLVVSGGDRLLAVGDTFDRCGAFTGAETTAVGGTFPSCASPTAVQVFDSSTGDWTTMGGGEKPVGSVPSPTVYIGGQLVSVTSTFTGELVTSVSRDSGGVWTQGASLTTGLPMPFGISPMIAASDRDVVAIGPEGTGVLVGHLTGDPGDPAGVPLPTAKPGPTLSPDVTLPGATDAVPALTTPATDPGQTPPATEPAVTVAGIPAASVPLTITFRLATRSVVAGGSIAGVIEVTNPRKEPVKVDQGGCESSFFFTLSDGSTTLGPMLPLMCVMGPLDVQPGLTTIPVRVDARYFNCNTSGRPSADMPMCETGTTPPPLPTGTWTVTVQNPYRGVDVQPPSIDIQVVAP